MFEVFEVVNLLSFELVLKEYLWKLKFGKVEDFYWVICFMMLFFGLFLELFIDLRGGLGFFYVKLEFGVDVVKKIGMDIF